MMKQYFLITCAICAIACFSQQLHSTAIQNPYGPMGNQGQPPMPNPDDIEAINQYLEDLQHNDPEQLRELERMGNELIMSLSPEELDEFSAMFGVDPQELRREAETFLQKEGPSTTPEAQEPILPREPEKSDPSTAKPKTTQTKQEKAESEPRASTKAAESAKDIIRATLNHLEELLIKEAASEKIQSLLRTWNDDLANLVFFLKTINRREHFLKLPLEKHSQLLDDLKTLNEKLERALPLIDPSIEQTQSDAYAFFDFTTIPSPEALKEAYEKKRQQYNPENIRKKIETNKNISEAQLKRELKAARIMQIAIDEEYEKLSDPKNIQEIERQTTKKQEAKEETYKQWKSLISSITKELGTLFFEKKLLVRFEDYLKEHEPQALEQKKAREKAIEEQKKAQTAQAKKTPIKTPGSSFEPKVTYKQPNQAQSYYNQGYQPGARPQRQSPYSSNTAMPQTESEKKSSDTETLGDKKSNKEKLNEQEIKFGKTSKKEKAALEKQADQLKELELGLAKALEILYVPITATQNKQLTQEQKEAQIKKFLDSPEASTLLSTLEKITTVAQTCMKAEQQETTTTTEKRKKIIQLASTLTEFSTQLRIVSGSLQHSVLEQINLAIKKATQAIQGNCINPNISNETTTDQEEQQSLRKASNTEQNQPMTQEEFENTLATLQKAMEESETILTQLNNQEGQRTLENKNKLLVTIKTVHDSAKKILSITQQINSAELNTFNQNMLSSIKPIAKKLRDTLPMFLKEKPTEEEKTILKNISIIVTELETMSQNAPDLTEDEINQQNGQEVPENRVGWGAWFGQKFDQVKTLASGFWPWK